MASSQESRHLSLRLATGPELVRRRGDWHLTRWQAITAMEFDDVVDKYARLISSAVKSVCQKRHAHLAEDAEQEVRLTMWRLIQAGKDIEYPETYVYKVALTAGLRVVEQAERQRAVAQSYAEAASGQHKDVATAVENAQHLRLALDQLSGNQRNAVRAYLTGFNHQEIAKLFGWSQSIARHNIYRGIQRLKRALPRTVINEQATT